MHHLNSIILWTCLLVGINLSAQTNWYVKASDNLAANTGLNWNNTISLDSALVRASEGDIIHVASGIYIPQVRLTNGKVDRERCFEIKKNITLIGGYPENADAGTMVNPALYPTILSGRLDEATYAYHVVVITAAAKRNKTVRLSGFTIRDGMADNTRRTTINDIVYQQSVGGGLIAESGIIDISDCIFTNNKAKNGGGCWIQNAVLNMHNSELIENTADTEKGGGLYLNSAVLNFDKIKLKNNLTKTDGGGIYITNSKGSLSDCFISGNSASNEAGGIYTGVSSYIYLYNSTISSNQAKKSGGIYLDNSYMQLGNTTLHGNSASEIAGAVRCISNARMDLISTTITANTSDSIDGVQSDNTCELSFYNSILSGHNYDFNSAQETIPTTLRQSILGSGYYNGKGQYVAGVTFDAASMLDSLNYNDGTTPGCRLLNTGNNPAVTKAVTSEEIIELASRYGLPGFVLLTDQRDKSRNKQSISIGSYQSDPVNSNVIPDFWHLIMYGQSLAEGYQSYPSISSSAIPNNYMIGNNVAINNSNQNFNQLAPLFASPTPSDIERNFQKSWLDPARCENAVIGAANHIQQKLTEPRSIIASSCATGGKTIEELSKHSQRSPFYYHRDFLKTIESAADIAGKNYYNITCPAFFWMQGEQNYLSRQPGLITATDNTTDKNAYKDLMLTLKNDMQNDVMLAYQQARKPLFITYQVGGKYIVGFEQNIAMAQLEASNEESDIVCAGPVYVMSDRNAGHLDANGYRWFGEMLGKVFYKTYIQGGNFTPLQPAKISKHDNNTLYIDYLVPVKPLVIDTLLVKREKNLGFVVKDNNVEKEIESITLDQNGETVIIKCKENLTGDIEVAYAGADVLGHGNLRDSDPYQAFYNYIDLDGKDENGNYIFEHDAANTSLHPRYEPRDSNGIIYDKPYPLYNFSLHFYYKLPAGTTELIPPSLIGETSNPELSDINENKRLIYLSDNQIEITGSWHKASFYDLSGKLCLETNKTGSINTSKLKKGLFLIKVEYNSGNLTFKYLR